MLFWVIVGGVAYLALSGKPNLEEEGIPELKEVLDKLQEQIQIALRTGNWNSAYVRSLYRTLDYWEKTFESKYTPEEWAQIKLWYLKNYGDIEELLGRAEAHVARIQASRQSLTVFPQYRRGGLPPKVMRIVR